MSGCASDSRENIPSRPAIRSVRGSRAAGYIGNMSDVTITPKPDGPLLVQGPVRVLTPDGRDIPVPPRKDGRPAEVVVLCRCGGSATKPFCDGAHKRNGFTDAPAPRL